MQCDVPIRRLAQTCPQCWRGISDCVCSTIEPEKNFIEVLILQHPREIRNPLGTARLVSLTLEKGVHRIGLSWRSLSHALGHATDPNRWVVLSLGGRQTSLPSLAQIMKNRSQGGTSIQGIIVLDGNWKQAKTLWWRNPWLKKLNRAGLSPSQPSRYGEIRRQPRKSNLCTLESVSLALKELSEKASVVESLDRNLDLLLNSVK